MGRASKYSNYFTVIVFGKTECKHFSYKRHPVRLDVYANR